MFKPVFGNQTVTQEKILRKTIDSTIKDIDKRQCIRRAEAQKAQYRIGRTIQTEPTNQTLYEAIEAYTADRSNALSPATIRKYENIKANHWPLLMGMPLGRIPEPAWQRAVNDMLSRYATKTVSVSWGMIKTVCIANRVTPPKVSIGKNFRTEEKTEFLEPEQIKLFVEAAKTSKYCIPLLLALSSMRIAEIDGLYWENVSDTSARVVQVRVMDKSGHYVIKRGAKNETSVRTVEFLIPELISAVKTGRRSAGKVMSCAQQTLRRECVRLCNAAGIPPVTVHGLRHSFASLTAHLGIPEIVSQEIGGWANDIVMKKVYTHVATTDKTNCLNRLRAFYGENL